MNERLPRIRRLYRDVAEALNEVETHTGPDTEALAIDRDALRSSLDALLAADRCDDCGEPGETFGPADGSVGLCASCLPPVTVGERGVW